MMKEYKRWLKCTADEVDLHKELLSVEENQVAIAERFAKSIEFGTGGLRGVIGAGTARMNVFTVARATRGLVQYLIKRYQTPTVAIGYDSRIQSERFAEITAAICAEHNIHVNMYPQLMPTPALSYAVRALQCSAGVCITASHNPTEYNGYKVYDSYGCQITQKAAREIWLEIEKQDYFNICKVEKDYSRQYLHTISDDLVQSYLHAVYNQRMGINCQDLKVVYTPLNGAGKNCVTQILSRINAKVNLVPEQSEPDGNFLTCPKPNPEEMEALTLGLCLAETQGADLLLATDPDCDRVGVAVRHKGKFLRLNGNEVGVLLLEFIASQRREAGTMPKNPIAIKTIVTTDLAQKIANHYGITLQETLTGFKYIGEKIGEMEIKGMEEQFIFGFEESCGYLSGDYVRDKDAVVACLLISEMTMFYKQKRISLIDALEMLYSHYGWYCEKLLSFEFNGLEGIRYMQELMGKLRKELPTEFAAEPVIGTYDYLYAQVQGSCTLQDNLPRSDVLKFFLRNGGTVVIRPSGTETKVKVYISCIADSRKLSKERMALMITAVQKLPYFNAFEGILK
jgi:phosphoglucomutase